MKLKLVLLGVALGLSSAAHAGTYSCAFETNQTPLFQCNIDSVSEDKAKCTFNFPDTNLTGACVIVTAQGDTVDLLACQIGVLAERAAPGKKGATPEDIAKVLQSKTVPTAIKNLAQLPGFAAAAANISPTNKANVHLGYIEKEGAPLLSAICPATMGKQ